MTLQVKLLYKFPTFLDTPFQFCTTSIGMKILIINLINKSEKISNNIGFSNIYKIDSKILDQQNWEHNEIFENIYKYPCCSHPELSLISGPKQLSLSKNQLIKDDHPKIDIKFWIPHF